MFLCCARTCRLFIHMGVRGWDAYYHILNELPPCNWPLMCTSFRTQSLLSINASTSAKTDKTRDQTAGCWGSQRKQGGGGETCSISGKATNCIAWTVHGFVRFYSTTSKVFPLELPTWASSHRLIAKLLNFQEWDVVLWVAWEKGLLRYESTSISFSLILLWRVSFKYPIHFYMKS